MRASIDIDNTLLTEVIEKSGAKTKKAAILIQITSV